MILNSQESTIYGAQFEIEDGNYTGKSEGTNTGSQMKDDIIKQIKEGYPDIPLVGAIGDDEADKSLFDASSENGGFCVAVGDNPKFAAILESDGFHLYKEYGTVS